MTCVLVPFALKELMLFICGLFGYLRCLCIILMGSSVYGIFGFGVSKCSECGILFCSSDNANFMRLVTFVAVSRWSTLDFIELVRSGRSVGRFLNIVFSAWISIGSFSDVPVLCVSI